MADSCEGGPDDAAFLELLAEVARLRALEEAGQAIAAAGGRKIPRNARCPCGSGKKFKRCCSPVISGQ